MAIRVSLQSSRPLLDAMHVMRRFATGCIAALALLATTATAATPPTIFAAASLQPALAELAQAGVLGRPAPRLVFASSSALARQVESGAPADVFISADERWMDDAAHRGAIVPATRVDLLGNALVLVVSVDS